METSTVSAQLGPGEQLHELLVNWRRRVDPTAVPGLMYGRNAPSKKRVSQEDVARLVGVSTRWYSNLERGEPGSYSTDFLDQVSAALRLSSEERTVLYLLATGREPDPQRVVAEGEHFESLRAIVAAMPWPAYVSDEAWDCLFYNRHMVTWFPHMKYETNIMFWPYLYPESKLQLVDWERSWARPMLAQLRAAIARTPDNVRLQEVIQRILSGSDDARRIWDEEAEVQVHPDGDRRLMHVPHFAEPRQIEIIALSVLRTPGFRLMQLIPSDQMGVRPASHGAIALKNA